MKRVLLFIFLLCIISCQNPAEKKIRPADYLPEDVAIIVKSPDINGFLNNYSENSFLTENPFFDQFQSSNRLNFLDVIETAEESFLCFSDFEKQQPDYIFISGRPPQLKSFDSIQNRSVETIKEDNFEFKKYNFEGSITYTFSQKNLFLASNSSGFIKETLQQKNLPKPALQKIISATEKNKTSLILNHQKLPYILRSIFPQKEFENLGATSTWSEAELEIEAENIHFNGLLTTTANPASIYSVFQNAGRGSSKMAEIVPASVQAFSSFCYENFEGVQKNLQQLRGDTLTTHLFSNSSEFGMIYLKNAPVFAIRSNEAESSNILLKQSSAEIGDFRGLSIFQLQENPETLEIFHPLITLPNAKYWAQINNFIIFAEQPAALEEIISASQNNHTLSVQESYQETLQQLSSQSSLLFVANGKNFLPLLAEEADADLKEKILNMPFHSKIAALQLVREDDFFHVHGIINTSEKTPEETSAPAEILNITLEDQLSTRPFFIKNHLTNQEDIAVHDINNTLYLISNEGQVYWKKQLENRVTGEIHQVDLFKNGKFQLAFSTLHALHVIDRNGNPVAPFPLEFKDEITQPLAVFDYDNNRKYRFIITQNSRVYMYNKKGKIVKGFDFKKAGAEITNPPKHIRIGTKDYILVPEASGKVNVLNRQGHTRVPVKENFKPSGNEWWEYQQNFISATPEELVKIDEKGGVKKQVLNTTEETKIVATPEILISFYGNLLKIEDTLIEMDYGVYTSPQIFKINNETLIAITDKQAKKVYIFNRAGELLQGFPVFGTSQIDLSNINLDKKPEFTVQGEENEILVYQF
ncbi:DUF3352 domain-containing protein [Zunongwangia sp. F363]|uniref:DUF3352 domain-containing protein n=1 Tax=Autumnicola tepida TaxID=3075595 RepID=A0ABU3CBC8_9FLAO|nr:DUF3352 domain-containing protein [Zunongwangia sp. F363]MDT0643635.1 DUF3352 domain-containing protein [Zunongwangia sp. F363]